ncbi:Sb-PDE family phosphodiesterase [Aurantibacter sp.]|uniref:Sb-PDE family phosphodiesterase n=1 Tax=Aurantibacter sp. TaxID=2807103 RepID=UPI003265473C
MKKSILFCFAVISFYFLSAQEHSHVGAQPIHFPDIVGYKTLKTDLHMHTVFSDGNVWPTIRVQEALRENLDAISLTEHLEYQPHAADIPHPDRNRAHEIALEEAKEHDLLIVQGSEITRSEPVGHNNAVFITDANKVLKDKPEQSFSEAKKQGAFVFWNHPAWHRQSPTGNPILTDFQKKRIKNDELHGIEVINTTDYSKESLAIALEQNLTIMGTSDIHGLIDWDYTEKGNHRPITLVFAKEKSLAGLKEALFAGRTVAVYNSLLVGKPEYLNPLIKASIKINSARYEKDTQVLIIEIENTSSSDLLLENAMPFSFYSKSPIFTIAAGKKETLQVKTLTELKKITLQLTALGAYTAPDLHPVIAWDISVEK